MQFYFKCHCIAPYKSKFKECFWEKPFHSGPMKSKLKDENIRNKMNGIKEMRSVFPRIHVSPRFNTRIMFACHRHVSLFIFVLNIIKKIP